MAYYNYYRPRNWRSQSEIDSLKGIINPPARDKKKKILRLNNFLAVPDYCQFIVRMEYTTDNPGQLIYTCNKALRYLVNKKARKYHIIINGVRFINILGVNPPHKSFTVVYNIALDHLYSAIWLMVQMAPIEECEEFCWIRKDVPVERWAAIRERCRPSLFSMICEIFNKDTKINMVEVGNCSIHIGHTGREHLDFSPQRQAVFYFRKDKPRYRSVQYLGKTHFSMPDPHPI